MTHVYRMKLAYRTGQPEPIAPCFSCNRYNGVWSMLAAFFMILSAGCSNLVLSTGQPNSPCQEAAECDDGNPCTRDECLSGRCSITPQPGVTCSSDEECRIGVCDQQADCISTIAQGEPCEDGDPCTGDDQCLSTGVCEGRIDKAVGEPCEDGDPCTVGTQCDSSGECQGGSPSLGRPSCEGKDPCTFGNVCLEDGSCSEGRPRELVETNCEVCICDAIWGVSCDKPKVIECPCNLWGNVQFVDSFPDFTIRFVDSFPDIEVRLSAQTPSGPGHWREVTSFPDFTVKVVDSFPDLEIRLTDSPDTPCED